MNALLLQIPSRKEYFLREKIESDEQSVASNSSSSSSKSVKRSRKRHTEAGPEDTKSKTPQVSIAQVSIDSVRTSAKVAKVEQSKVVSESKKDASAGDGTQVTKAKRSNVRSRKISKVKEPVNTSAAGEVGTNTNTNKENVKVGTNRRVQKVKVVQQKEVKLSMSDSDDIDIDSELGDAEIAEEENYRQQMHAKEEKLKQQQPLSVTQASQVRQSKPKGNRKTKTKTEIAQKKEQTRNSWFDPNKFDTSRMRHPKKVKKELPEGATIFCSKCNETFESADELTSHEKTCFKGRRYPCEYDGEDRCECTFSQKSLMHQHLKAVHFEDPFRCSLCPETFVYKKSLDTHLNKLHGLKKKTDFKYQCTECDKATDDLTEFQVHTNRHHNIKPYRCNLCNAKSFYSQSQLSEHLRKCRSSMEPKFECSVCGKKFVEEDRYREHFKSQHVDTVTGEIYYCKICIIRMFTSNAFNKHCETGRCKDWATK